MIVKLHTIPWGLHCGFHPAHIKKATLPCYQKSCTWDSTPSGELWSRYSKQGLEKTWELFIMLPKHSPQPPPQNQGILLKKHQTIKENPTKQQQKQTTKTPMWKTEKQPRKWIPCTLISFMIWEGNGAQCWQPGGQSLLSSRASSPGKGNPGTFSILLKVAFTSLLMSAIENREQILSASVFVSTEAENHFQTLLAFHSKGHRVHFQSPLSDLLLYLMCRGKSGEGVLIHSCGRQSPITAR